MTNKSDKKTADGASTIWTGGLCPSNQGGAAEFCDMFNVKQQGGSVYVVPEDGKIDHQKVSKAALVVTKSLSVK